MSMKKQFVIILLGLVGCSVSGEQLFSGGTGSSDTGGGITTLDASDSTSSTGSTTTTVSASSSTSSTASSSTGATTSSTSGGSCVPKTCATYSIEESMKAGINPPSQACNIMFDGCSKYIDCGSCATPCQGCGEKISNLCALEDCKLTTYACSSAYPRAFDCPPGHGAPGSCYSGSSMPGTLCSGSQVYCCQ